MSKKTISFGFDFRFLAFIEIQPLIWELSEELPYVGVALCGHPFL
jgi:hypothetical protein